MKLLLIAKRSLGAAIASASALGLLIGCTTAWLVWSNHIPAHYPQAAFAPIGAVLATYTLIVVATLGRNARPTALVLSAAILGSFLTVLVGAVLNEMILCHYDRYACINL